MKTTADHNARTAALDPNTSFIVQAPAGSGKTELLTQRFLNLLAHAPQHPEEIIAITFTKKAAAEMRARILQALKLATQPAPTQQHQRTTWQLAKAALERDQRAEWHLLENPNRLRILTIDALSLSITQYAPLLSELGTQPAIATDPNELYLRATKNLLNNIQHSPIKGALETLLLHLDNRVEYTIGLLAYLLQNREQWLPYIIQHSHDSQQLKKQLEQALRQVSLDALAHLKIALDPSLRCSLTSVVNAAGQYLQQNDSSNPLAALSTLSSQTEFNQETQALWKLLADMLLTNKAEWRKRMTKRQGFAAKSENKAVIEALLPSIQQNDRLKQALINLQACPPDTYTTQQWSILESLLLVLPHLVANLRIIMQAHGAIDFTEITLAALRALGDEGSPTDLALYLDYKIHHLLIDEFQDTSATQFHLFEKLTHGWQPGDGRSIFLVGDPMQSIYRFRNAEVGLFLQAQQFGINALPLTFLQLTQNFRSSHQIVDWINQTFQTIMPTDADIAKGAIPYSASIAANQTQPGQIHYHSSIEQADALNQAVIDLVNSTPKEESIAILVRSRKQLKDLIPALHREKIHFNAVDIEPLMHYPEIKDCIALTQALMHRADNIAWLSCLRAPWCGLSLADLLLLTQSKKTTLYACINDTDTLEQLPADSAQRLAHFTNAIRPAIENMGQCCFSHCVESCWKSLNAADTLTNQQAFDNVEQFFQLLSKIEAQEGVVTLDKLESEAQKLFASTEHNVARLQIMTIHKSKGLEFDHVILPGLEKSSGQTDAPLLQWLERPHSAGEIDLLLAPIKSYGDDSDPIYRFLQQTEKQKYTLESARLLYVACTRAKKSLSLLAVLQADDKLNSGLKPPRAGSHLALLWPQHQDAFSQHKTNNHCDHAILTPESPNHHLWRLKLSALNTEARDNTLESQSYNATPTLKIEAKQDSARLIGTIVHATLQMLCESKTSQLSCTDLQFWKQRWQRQLRQHQCDSPSALETISTAINRTLRCPKGQWILNDGHDFSACEYPISQVRHGKVQHMVLDRVIIEHKTAWIIDFKTSQPDQNIDINSFIHHELEQYRKQLQQYHNAIRSAWPDQIRCILYFPLMDPAWVEVNIHNEMEPALG